MTLKRTVTAVVLVGLIALATWAELALDVVPFRKHDVAMPPDSATPAQVVAAYIAALDAHDCDRARSLWLGDEDTPQAWCSSVRSARIVDGRHAFHESPTRMDVVVDLDVRWRPFHDDGTIGSDPFGWVYILKHDDAGAWRIIDSGEGP